MSRNRKLDVRMNEADYAAVHEAADALDMTPSAYVRMCIGAVRRYGGGEGGEPVLMLDPLTWSQILREANHWGTNYNQGVRALNRIAMILRQAGPSVLDRERSRAGLLQDARVAARELAMARESIDQVARSAIEAAGKAQLGVRHA